MTEVLFILFSSIYGKIVPYRPTSRLDFSNLPGKIDSCNRICFCGARRNYEDSQSKDALAALVVTTLFPRPFSTG